jgi:hypothetical protein
MVGTVAAVVAFTGLGLWFISMLAAVLSLVLRFRASRGTERQQLRWIAARGHRRGGRAGGGIAGVVVTYFAVICLPSGGRGRAALPAVGPGPPRLPDRHLRRRHRRGAHRLPAGPARRHDAARTVEVFATRLRDQVDLGALPTELLGVVDQTMQPTHP